MLTDEQIKRYARQIIMPEIGVKGQLKLLDSSVLVVGAGGLGSPAIQYLAGAGVGRIGIVDGDVVDISNLQRQTIHAGNLGMNKAESAKIFVEKLNPDVKVDVYPFNLTPENAREIIKKYDVVLDCTDNFVARFLINDACVIEEVPFVHAAVLRFEGEIMTVVPKESACYRCVFKHAPPPGTVPSCQEAGVVGATVGVLGTLQAVEAIKLLLGIGETLVNRMLHVDLLTMDFTELKLRKDPECPVCSGRVKDIIPEKYVESCQL
ncbi:UBA/THIF-type NAD/FAD binding protein [Ferroglobus placidus DSM 10642]|uniref:UBA/THIF-type NAD/FAD binding protein n=1 Tax=Ferroglobus placidus (strain DSM 10642 / AEDII12DO) TaxID=589924 RepID=D3S0U6_FERPA|nr:HesA/MoeB/ThiF family protein [Ferroglobus placidus]ADC66337.1 UBA/THIF-type NAD/FAD binding protein [Ferroglobus placidus DSM 10642]